MSVDWLRQCNRLYELLHEDAEELGMLRDLVMIHVELVLLLLAEKQTEASQLLTDSRVCLWSRHAKEKIDELEKKLRPRQIFDNRSLDELQAIERSYAATEPKIQRRDLTVIDDFKAILKSIDSTSEYADRLRSKSAFDAVKDIFKTGIIITATLFGVFIALGQQYLYWTLAPLGITFLVAAGMYGLIRAYPSISRRHLALLANILVLLLAMIWVLSSP